MRTRDSDGQQADGEFHLSDDSVRQLSAELGPPPGNRRFTSTDHLSTEAIAAYVDDALPAAGRDRARLHLDRCPQCREEVEHQEAARSVLRGSGPIRMPEDLRDRLRDIATSPECTTRESEPTSLWQRLTKRLRRGKG